MVHCGFCLFYISGYILCLSFSHEVLSPKVRVDLYLCICKWPGKNNFPWSSDIFAFQVTKRQNAKGKMMAQTTSKACLTPLHPTTLPAPCCIYEVSLMCRALSWGKKQVQRWTMYNLWVRWKHGNRLLPYRVDRCCETRDNRLWTLGEDFLGVGFLWPGKREKDIWNWA